MENPIKIIFGDNYHTGIRFIDLLDAIRKDKQKENKIFFVGQGIPFLFFLIGTWYKKYYNWRPIVFIGGGIYPFNDYHYLSEVYKTKTEAIYFFEIMKPNTPGSMIFECDYIPKNEILTMQKIFRWSGLMNREIIQGKIRLEKDRLCDLEIKIDSGG